MYKKSKDHQAAEEIVALSKKNGMEMTHEEALKKYREKAILDDGSAMYDLGSLYEQSKDYQAAAKWYVMAAEAGYDEFKETLNKPLNRVFHLSTEIRR